MSHLKIFRASAGSGKTYTLTGEYINMLFSTPNDYHKILAVTFTNKATAEMRNRILENLYQLSNSGNQNPEHLADLMKKHGLREAQVRQRAKQILASLLHDYSRFSVSTIDSFFQHIVRSFAREMGLPMGFRLELQPNQIMTQAIDRVIMEMDQPNHADLKKWLIEFAETKMEQDQGWNILREIKQLSEAIYSEVFQANAATLWHELADKAQLTAYRQTLRTIVSDTDQAIERIGKQALEIIAVNGLNIHEDFYRKSASPVKIFLKMDTLRSFTSTQTYLTLVDNVDQWGRKDNSPQKNQAIKNGYNQGLNQLLKDAMAILAHQGRNYFTATAILENFNALGIVNDVSGKMAELCREKNLFLISGTNHLLSRIIDNNETPFIYEKTGTRFSHFMIDEFQDTSTLQYLNFKPLIQESLASQNQTLLVGDVKQAIYRWRNSDWNLLNSEVEKDFTGFGVDPCNLDVNWRSHQTVIEFNNAFFPQAASLLQQAFNEVVPDQLKDDLDLKPLGEKIVNAYKDVVQKVSPRKINSGGKVYVGFLEGSKKETEEGMIARVVDQILTLLKQGYQLADICILVRTNKVGIIVTNALLSGFYHPLKQSIAVISSESLLLSASEAIKLLIHQLKYLQNTSDQILESFIRLTWFKHNASKPGLYFDPSDIFNLENESVWQNYKNQILKLQERPLYELATQLIELMPVGLKEHHSVYIQSFMSLLLDFINNETADLSAFIDFWDKNADKFSLSVPENQQAIKVMTIHKSKGLEFKAVILPYFNWEILSRSNNLLWIKPLQEPFNQLTLVPVSFKKDLLNSHFAPYYLNEILQQYVDNLNLTYVAFTRARESLSIIGSIKSREIKSFQTVADVLYYYFTHHRTDSEWNDNLLEYNTGRFPAKELMDQEQIKEIRPHRNIDANQIKNTSFRGKVKMHLESTDYFHHEEQIRKINYGKIMHQLFENIVVEADLETALKTMRHKGRITLDDYHHLKKNALAWLHDSRTRKWFDGSYSVKTEADILWHEQRRPDRVMIGKHEVIVVDYKFGDQKLATHQKQVRGYIDYIQKMGYQTIKGYLWYVTLGEVVEVSGQNTLFD